MTIYFKGRHWPLSNFYPCQILYLGISISQSQLSRVTPHLAYQIRNPTASNSKFPSKQIRTTKAWHNSKINFHMEFLWIKFNTSSVFREFLLSTGIQNITIMLGARTGVQGTKVYRIFFSQTLNATLDCHLPPPLIKDPSVSPFTHKRV